VEKRLKKKSIDLIEGPPSPFNTSISKSATGGMECTRAAGSGSVAGTEDGIGRGKQKTTLSPHN